MYLSRKLLSAFAIVWSMERAQNFWWGKKFLLKSDHKPLEFLFNPRKELPRVKSSRILRWAIKIMAFDFDIIFVKGNTIPHVDALSRLRFQSENGMEHENSEDRIIQWVETDVQSRKTLIRETQLDPILSGILWEHKKECTEQLYYSGETFQRRTTQITGREGVIFSADAIVPPQILRKDVIKSLYDDIHGGDAATQRRLRLQAWWPGYYKDVEEYIRRCPKCTEIKTFKQLCHEHLSSRQENGHVMP